LVVGKSEDIVTLRWWADISVVGSASLSLTFFERSVVEKG